MSRPRLLDLYCGAGGASFGYWRAGFDVLGVDHLPQPHYPFDFELADALTFPLDGFDVIHASPPCQDHSSLAAMNGTGDTGWQLRWTLERLDEFGTPWVCENVAAASVTMSGWWFTLCGSSFGLGVRRHRRFGSSHLVLAPDCRHVEQPHPIDVTGTGGASTRPRTDGKGGLSRKTDAAGSRAAMGIDWMTRRELAQAVPPAYTEHIGRQLLPAAAEQQHGVPLR